MAAHAGSRVYVGGLWALAVGLASLAGCGRAGVNKSPDAAPLPTIAAATQATNDANWPSWRGHNGQGIADGFPLPEKLTNHVAWQIDVPGTGNSSPVIWGDKLFLTAQIDSGQLVVLAYDRQTGKPLWRADTRQSAGGATHVKNGHASASVATDGERVIACFGSAGLFAFDMDGHPLWNQELGPLEHIWGAAASPVIYQDLVIQLCDSKDIAYLAAFDKTTGKPAWRTERDSHGCWTTPVVATAAGESPRDELIVNGTGTDGSPGAVIAYAPRTGEELWRVEGTTEIVCPTAIIGAGLVVSTSGRNGPIIAIKPDDAAGAHVVWKTRKGGPYVPTGVAYLNRLYLVTDGGVLTCQNLGDGAPIWQHRLGGAFTASLVAGDGKILAVNERGAVSIVKAGDEFTLLGEESLDERVLATPALCAGNVYLRTEKRLYRFGGAAKAD